MSNQLSIIVYIDYQVLSPKSWKRILYTRQIQTLGTKLLLLLLLIIINNYYHISSRKITRERHLVRDTIRKMFVIKKVT